MYVCIYLCMYGYSCVSEHVGVDTCVIMNNVPMSQGTNTLLDLFRLLVLLLFIFFGLFHRISC